MKAQVRSLISTDIGSLPLENWTPENPADFGILLRAFVGPENERGEEAFDFIACTPSWLQRELKLGRIGESSKGYMLGRGYIVLLSWNYQLVHEVIEGLCKSVTGPDWNAVAWKLARYALWEFDNHTE